MKKRGFTLIEMLIVIVIIGILAGALIPRIGNARDKANDVAREANVKSITTAISQALIDDADLGDICTADGIAYGELGNYGITNSLDNNPTNDDTYNCRELANEHFIVYSSQMSEDSAAANCTAATVGAYTTDTSFSTAAAAITDDGDAYCMVQ